METEGYPRDKNSENWSKEAWKSDLSYYYRRGVLRRL